MDDVERIGAIGAGDQRVQLERGLGFGLVELGGLPARLADHVDREVRDDAVEPGEEARASLEGRQPLVDPEKCLLNDLTGVVLVANETEGDAERPALVPFDERTERGSVTLSGCLELLYI